MNKILFEVDDISSDIKSNGDVPNEIIRPLGGIERFLSLQLKWALQYQDIVTISILRISTLEKHKILLNDPKYLLRALQLWTRKHVPLRCYLKQMDKNEITSLAYTSFGSRLSPEQLMEQVEVYETVDEWLKNRPSDNSQMARTNRLVRFHFEEKSTTNKVPWWNSEVAYQMGGRHDVYSQPLWRLVLLMNEELQEFALVIPLHHSIVDGVSAKHYVDDFINIWLAELNEQLKSDIDVKEQFLRRYENQKVERMVNSLDSILKPPKNLPYHPEEEELERENMLLKQRKYSFLEMKDNNIPIHSGSPKFMSTFIDDDTMHIVMKKIKEQQCKMTAAVTTASALAWRRTCKQMSYMIDQTVITAVPINFTNSVKDLKSEYPFPRAVCTDEKDEVGLIQIPASTGEKDNFWNSARNVRKDFERILNSKEVSQGILKKEVDILDTLDYKDTVDFPDGTFYVHYCLSNIGRFVQKSVSQDFFVNEQFYFVNGSMENSPYGSFMLGVTSNNDKLCFGLEYDSRAASEEFMLNFIDNLQAVFKSNIFT
ncbi:hypothetical protein SNEBB_002589 [Seison nebaliae]|nr:hypothetical protein SNEBB_002589 [Seison nebaliae]